VAAIVGQVIVVLDILVGSPLAGENALDPDTEHEPTVSFPGQHAARNKQLVGNALQLPIVAEGKWHARVL
jgi:hypothetical protein